jgi:hypothetical protein
MYCLQLNVTLRLDIPMVISYSKIINMAHAKWGSGDRAGGGFGNKDT